jgi:hypothetical protein
MEQRGADQEVSLLGAERLCRYVRQHVQGGPGQFLMPAQLVVRT